MKLSIISFTRKGEKLSEKLAGQLREIECVLYTKCSACRDADCAAEFVGYGIGVWAGGQLREGNALLFIGACGIAVRAIAPHITDKLHDGPVLVMDELGQYVIPILSGHMGGANELALLLAKKLGAKPVLTTATDVNQSFAADIFAKRNSLAIMNKEGIAKVSAKVLEGKTVTLSVETGHLERRALPKGVILMEYPPQKRTDIVVTSEENVTFEAELLLRPREYVIGIGCRRGRETERIEAFIHKHLRKAGISINRVAGVASIDLKKDEAGLLAFCRRNRLPFVTYTAKELMCVEGEFHASAFVKSRTGTDNVCERAALKLCGHKGSLIYGKQAEDGMTIALARKDWRVCPDDK